MQLNIFRLLCITGRTCTAALSKLYYHWTIVLHGSCVELYRCAASREVARFAHVALEIVRFQKHNVNSSCRKCSKMSSPFK